MTPSSWDRFPSRRRPPPPGGRQAPERAKRGSRGFSSTWWGAAWVEALEQRARLDPNRLPRGRTYARQGHVLDIDLAAGSITAEVAGSRATPYTVTIRLRTFDDVEWARVADAIASKAAHAAALLDGELDPGVVDDARAVGVELLPDAGDLQPRCTCPDWADPCKHAAAVCYLVAPLLDEDPFELFALRGRTRAELLAAVRERRSGGPGPGDAGGRSGRSGPPAAGGGEPTSAPDAGHDESDHAAASPAERDAGVVARAAWERAADGSGGPPPVLPPVPAAAPRPGSPAPWPSEPPAELATSGRALRNLAADAAARAWGMVRQGDASGLHLDAASDLARRAAAAMGTERWEEVVSRCDLAPRDLAAVAIAYRHGGAEGVALLDAPAWSPPPAAMAEARTALEASGLPARSLRVSQNRVTVARWRAQLRVDRDGRWWGFAKQGNRWQLATPGHLDIDDAIDALASAVE
ncbi:MAG: SWIM zinc finger family protein [Acidimicrobiia bacterium]|nr:SWIM zinc finger family protein [Acidimicrobiia bacterium]